MSKLILWFVFILSVLLLSITLFRSRPVNPLGVALWVVILGYTGYMLFIDKSK